MGYNYMKAQLEKVSTVYGEFKPKIKIIKPNGETNWLDISEKQLTEIKAVLLDQPLIVRIIVKGGVAEVIACPANVQVKIVDKDNH